MKIKYVVFLIAVTALLLVVGCATETAPEKSKDQVVSSDSSSGEQVMEKGGKVKVKPEVGSTAVDTTIEDEPPVIIEEDDLEEVTQTEVNDCNYISNGDLMNFCNDNCGYISNGDLMNFCNDNCDYISDGDLMNYCNNNCDYISNGDLMNYCNNNCDYISDGDLRYYCNGECDYISNGEKSRLCKSGKRYPWGMI